MDHMLNANHVQEVRKYVTFFEQKRRESVKEIHTSFGQFQERKIKDDILSRAEVESLMNELRDEIKTTLDTELQTIVYMSGVYIKILMSQAESNNLQLQADISFIENEQAIEEMRNLGNFDRDVTKKTQGGRLPTLQASLANDSNASIKVKELTEENQGLKRKIVELQGKITEFIEEGNKYKSISENLIARAEGMHDIEVKEVSQALEETKVKNT